MLSFGVNEFHVSVTGTSGMHTVCSSPETQFNRMDHMRESTLTTTYICSVVILETGLGLESETKPHYLLVQDVFAAGLNKLLFTLMFTIFRNTQFPTYVYTGGYFVGTW